MATNSTRLIARHPLNNGLILEFWDHSRPVAGDRRYVLLETRITIPVRADTLPPELKGLSHQVIEALGPEITFSQPEARNFIAASAAAAILQDMQDRILALAPGYFGHADFAPRFIRRTYAAYQERQRLQPPEPFPGENP
jgi:hypothetical protein